MKISKNLMWINIVLLHISTVCTAMDDGNKNLQKDFPENLYSDLLLKWLGQQDFMNLDTSNCNRETRMFVSRAMTEALNKDYDEYKEGLKQDSIASKTAVVAVTFEHPSPKLRKLAEKLRDEQLAFWAHGGEQGRIYRITDPTGEVPPFLLSDEVARAVNHYEMMGESHPQYNPVAGPPLCEGKGEPPSRLQLEALQRATRYEGGRYQSDAIVGLGGVFVWSSSLIFSNNVDLAFVFYSRNAYLCSSNRRYRLDNKSSVRCVLPAEW